MPAITYTIQNNSVASVATVTLFSFVNDAGIAHSLNFQSSPGWNSPWNSYSNWTNNDTKITNVRTFIDEIDDVVTQYKAHSGTAILVTTTVGVSPGWTILSDPGFTAGQTVVSTSGTNWVIASAGPNGTPVPDDSLRFIPPDYRLRINNTIGITPGDTINGNGYNDEQTVVSVVDPEWLIISDQSPGTPVPGGQITFTQPLNPMTLIGIGATQQFQLDYTRSTSVLGTYTSTLSISGIVENLPFIKNVRNFALISAAPVVDPGSPFFDPGNAAPPVPPDPPPPPRRRRRRWQWWVVVVAIVIGVPAG